MLHRLSLAALLACAFLLSGCDWTRDLMKSDKVDYKSQAKANSDVPTLEVPPDLTKPKGDQRYAVSTGDVKRTVSATQEEQTRAQLTPASANPEVLPPVPNKDMRIERGGTQRWLVVSGKPDQYWDTIKQFWQENGFVISLDHPELGYMETDWAEKRSRISTNAVGRIVGSVFDNFTTTPERDKFRTRLETNAQGQTEIYISHRGLVEVYINEARDQLAWQPRPADPELEAEFLRRLMVRLGSDEKSAQALVANNRVGAETPKAALTKKGEYSLLVVDDGFDRAWRRVGLALDRVGFTVEDRDRSKGLFWVRYADPDAIQTKKEKEGWLSKLNIFKSKDPAVSTEQYQIKVTDAQANTQVTVLSKAGQPEESQTTRRILSLLQEDLK
ncbi:MAG TPA: outer membrane protein assembly factor BamC [Burkholderiales bacterium]|jgi:outer membrane protein assembly factor BamC